MNHSLKNIKILRIKRDSLSITHKILSSCLRHTTFAFTHTHTPLKPHKSLLDDDGVGDAVDDIYFLSPNFFQF